MKGELIRGRRTNHVLVDHEVVGSSMIPCPACHVKTNHALLEGNLKMCAVCREVTSHPIRSFTP